MIMIEPNYPGLDSPQKAVLTWLVLGTSQYSNQALINTENPITNNNQIIVSFIGSSDS